MRYGVKILYSIYPNDAGHWAWADGLIFDENAPYTTDINKAHYALEQCCKALPNHKYAVEEIRE